MLSGWRGWMIIIGRMPYPDWLSALAISGGIVVVDEDDLRFDEQAMAELADKMGVSLTSEDTALLLRRSEGCASLLCMAMELLLQGEPVGEPMLLKLNKIYTNYLEQYIISAWSLPVQEGLMRLSVVDSFDLPLA
ncbi:MAG: hypothetical protein Q4C54_07975 [Clostridia bacterium]|nr:hypothetical protein [Clostridia bacterium]